MSLARRHRERVFASTAALNASSTVTAASAVTASSAMVADRASPVDRASAEIAMRLTHDLRRLKEIRSIDLKVAAKREMLPEYRSWVDGVLAADAGVCPGLAGETVATTMVWSIDISDFARALEILPFMLRHRVAMPSRYQRDAATLVVEEIADQALRLMQLGEPFPIEVLQTVHDATDALDMHDEVRAKLHKALGIAGLAIAEDLPADEVAAALKSVIADLTEAQRLDPRIGVKDRLKRAQKLLDGAAASGPTETQTGDQTVA